MGPATPAKSMRRESMRIGRASQRSTSLGHRSARLDVARSFDCSSNRTHTLSGEPQSPGCSLKYTEATAGTQNRRRFGVSRGTKPRNCSRTCCAPLCTRTLLHAPYCHCWLDPPCPASPGNHLTDDGSAREDLSDAEASGQLHADHSGAGQSAVRPGGRIRQTLRVKLASLALQSNNDKETQIRWTESRWQAAASFRSGLTASIKHADSALVSAPPVASRPLHRPCCLHPCASVHRVVPWRP